MTQGDQKKKDVMAETEILGFGDRQKYDNNQISGELKLEAESNKDFDDFYLELFLLRVL